MDDRLRLLQHLYDEDDDPATLRQQLAEEEGLRREYDDLRETKAVLDRAPSHSPHADVVDRVVARAEAATQATDSPSAPSAGRREADRSARAPSPEWTRRLQGVSAAVAVVLLAGIGWWGVTGGLDGTGGVAETPAPQATAGGQAAQAMPEWDDRDELVRIHRRIELLRSQDQMGSWGGDLQPVQATRP